MIFWFLGLLFNAFLFVTVLMRQTLKASDLSTVFTVILSVLDIWPFTIIIYLILDIFGDTGAFSVFERNMIKTLTKLFLGYTFFFPFFYCLIFTDFNEIQMNEFLIGSYVFLALFILFFSYIIFRLFICEKYIAGLYLGESALLKFQIGAGFLVLFLFVKIAVLYWFEVPPVEYSVFFGPILEASSKIAIVNAITYLISNSMIYSVPFILIALGANYSKGKSEADNAERSVIHNSIPIE